MGERGCRVVIQELGDLVGGRGMSAEAKGTPAVYYFYVFPRPPEGQKDWGV